MDRPHSHTMGWVAEAQSTSQTWNITMTVRISSLLKFCTHGHLHCSLGVFYFFILSFLKEEDRFDWWNKSIKTQLLFYTVIHGVDADFSFRETLRQQLHRQFFTFCTFLCCRRLHVEIEEEEEKRELQFYLYETVDKVLWLEALVGQLHQDYWGVTKEDQGHKHSQEKGNK